MPHSQTDHVDQVDGHAWLDTMGYKTEQTHRATRELSGSTLTVLAPIVAQA